MAVQSPVYHPTRSQYASAATHLERSSDWRVIRIDGVRYVVLQSGNSGRTYILRADASGCQCVWYQQTGAPCSHMLALELAATEGELRAVRIHEASQQQEGSADEADPTPATRYDTLYPSCAAGCGDIVDRVGESCLGCGSERAYRERIAAKIAAGVR